MRIRVSHPLASPVPCELTGAIHALGHAVRLDTTVYYKSETWRPFLGLLPAPIRDRAERALGRRLYPGLDPALVTTQPSAELLLTGARRLGLSVQAAQRLMTWRNRVFDRHAARLIRRDRPDVVIAHDYGAVHALGAAAILNQEIGHLAIGDRLMREEAELCPEFADTLAAPPSRGLLDRTRRAAATADQILVPSEYVRDTYIAEGTDPARIVLLPYGVATDRFQPPPERPDRPFRILFVGRISQRKGIGYLLEAVKRLVLKDAELVLVGTPVGQAAALDGYAGFFRLIRQVPHTEIHRLYHDARIYVFPSLHEGSSLTIYEALASGLPVITTPNAGSVVRDGSEGYIVPIRDTDALMDRILRLYRDPALCLEMGRAARARAEEYSWAAYRRRLGDWLDAVAAERRT